MKRNILGNFILDFYAPHEHRIEVKPSHLNAKDQQILLIILSTLLPLEPYASIEELDGETEVYEQMSINGRSFSWLDSYNTEIVKQLISQPTTIQLKVFPDSQELADIIFRRLVTREELKAEQNMSIYNDNLHLCL